MIAKTLIVTGALGGIGSRICQRAVEQGYDVIAIDKRRFHKTTNPHVLSVDLSRTGAAASVLRFLRKRCLVPYAVVLAHGIYKYRSISFYKRGSLQRQFECNFFSSFHLMRVLLPVLVHQGQGRVVFIGSQAAVTGGFDPAYASSKAAIVALMKSIAREYSAHGISANLVSPGPVNTRMARVMGQRRIDYYKKITPSRRFTEPEEVADTVLWLLSAGNNITGATIDIDGALVRR